MSAEVESPKLSKPRPGWLRRVLALVPAAILGLLVLGVMALVIVPGYPPSDPVPWAYSDHYYFHGWPLTFLERRSYSDDWPEFWKLTSDVYWWSPMRLAVDMVCALTIAGAFVLVFERWRRSPSRFAVGLRGMLVGVAILSFLMLLVGRRYRERAELFQKSEQLGSRLTGDCPQWLLTIIEDDGTVPEQILPKFFLRVDEHLIGFDGGQLQGLSDAEIDVGINQRRQEMELDPNEFELYLELDHQFEPRRAAQFVEAMGALQRLNLTAIPGIEPTASNVLEKLPHLRELELLRPPYRYVERGQIAQRYFRDTIGGGLGEYFAECLIVTMHAPGSVTIPAIRALRNHKQLKKLRICVDGWERSDFAQIGNLSKLEELTLLSRALWDLNLESLDELAAAPRLRSLDISHPWKRRRVSGIEALAVLRELNLLSLTNCQLEAKDIGVLAKLSKLERLNLSECRLTAEAFERLTTLPTLREFYVYELEVEGWDSEQSVGERIRELMPDSGVIE